MNTLPDVISGKILLLIGPQAERDVILDLTAVLALQNSVRVIDGGNRFDAYHVARQLRRQTHELEVALARISVARAFTCYQVVALFAQTAVSPHPQLILDLLTTFYDESVSVTESYRLLHLVIQHLRRLRQTAPIVVTVRPSPQPERAGLIKMLIDIADHVHIVTETNPVYQPPLFS